jgi:hypothetical protein
MAQVLRSGFQALPGNIRDLVLRAGNHVEPLIVFKVKKQNLAESQKVKT